MQPNSDQTSNVIQDAQTVLQEISKLKILAIIFSLVTRTLTDLVKDLLR